MRNFHISSLFTVFFYKKPAKMNCDLEKLQKALKPVDIPAFIRYNMQHNKKQRRELVVQGSPKESAGW